MNILKKLLLLLCIAPTGIIQSMYYTDGDGERRKISSNSLTENYTQRLKSNGLLNSSQTLNNVARISLLDSLKQKLPQNTEYSILSNFDNKQYLDNLSENPPYIDTMIIEDNENNKESKNLCYIDYRPTENAINSKFEQKYQSNIENLKEEITTRDKAISRLQSEYFQYATIKRSLERKNENLNAAAIMLSTTKSGSEEKLEKENTTLRNKLSFTWNRLIPLCSIGGLILGGLITWGLASYHYDPHLTYHSNSK